ncbi:hypothetical protein [Campylobacter ureolyticus]|uniref:hypothetical protein n=1 Tax=Campylobacter ureolyticus TaxID=827 RepID=UPI00290DB74F|nr:hypothetical protein [Campylobacter ureolyticus]MDU5326680.1 hypothetical protein [Campylobacter ureolyticus]
MKKFILLTLVALCISGCNLKNKFLKTENNNFVIDCGFFSRNEYLDDERVYKAKGKWLSIYERNYLGEYIKVDVFASYSNAKLPAVPIESCDDVWCKIYYPCEKNIEYFVKKDDICNIKTDTFSCVRQ